MRSFHFEILEHMFFIPCYVFKTIRNMAKYYCLRAYIWFMVCRILSASDSDRQVKSENTSFDFNKIRWSASYLFFSLSVVFVSSLRRLAASLLLTKMVELLFLMIKLDQLRFRRASLAYVHSKQSSLFLNKCQSKGWWWPPGLYCRLLGLGVPFHSHFPVPIAWQYICTWVRALPYRLKV